MIEQEAPYQTIHETTPLFKAQVNVPLECFLEASNLHNTSGPRDRRDRNTRKEEQRNKANDQRAAEWKTNRSRSPIATIFRAIIFLVVFPPSLLVAVFGVVKVQTILCRRTVLGSWTHTQDLCHIVAGPLSRRDHLEQFVNNVVDKRLDQTLQHYGRVVGPDLEEPCLDQDLSRLALDARVVTQLSSPTARDGGASLSTWALSFFGRESPVIARAKLPVVVLDPTMVPGDCWMFDGKQGHIAIKLLHPSNITAMAIHQVPASQLAPISRLQAPKTIILWGLVRTSDQLPSPSYHLSPMDFLRRRKKLPQSVNVNDAFVPLASMSYDLARNEPQVAYVGGSASQSFLYDIVILEVIDNWGGNSTCLYHVGIHGKWVTEGD